MEIQMEPDGVGARSHAPRGSAKLRFAGGTAAIVAVVSVGWVAGVVTREFSPHAQTSIWSRQTATAVASKLNHWRDPPLGTHSGDRLPETELIKAEETNITIAVQRMADALNARIDQLRASSEGRSSQLESRIEHLNGSVERIQRESLTKLDQLQTRLKAVEAQAAAAAVSIKKAQTRAAPKITPAPDQTYRSSRPQRPPEVSELPRVGTWSVWDVVDGTAVLEGPEGFITVSTGDVVPGAGRVEAIVRRGGRWVVATSKGVISDR